jgi:pseudaminic acid synthase
VIQQSHIKSVMSQSIVIESLTVGEDHPPVFIAEMSGHHGGSLDTALALVDAMAQAGAHGLKLQTYTADTMTLNCDGPGFVIQEANSLWRGERLYDLYEKAHTPWEWHKTIFDRCASHGMICFSTPFDETAVDFLEDLNAPCYKISSFECTDLPLIRRVAATGKPVIISTGMASEQEIDKAVSSARNAGCQDLILLKCTSSYPAPVDQAHLRALPVLKERFHCQVGLSDHTMGLAIPLASVAMGATLIEKHVTLARANGTVDAAFSLEPHEVKDLVTEMHRVWQAMGQAALGCNTAEEHSLAYRRSLYVAKDIAEGEPFTKENLRAIRPGFGLAPEHLEAVLGRPALKPLKMGEPMRWDYVTKA